LTWNVDKVLVFCGRPLVNQFQFSPGLVFLLLLFILFLHSLSYMG